MDVKYGLSNNLTMDLTYNTDFSQVEVDDAQVNLTQFNLFFPEKRAFFLENAGLFRFGVARATELFYSRNIGLARDLSGALRQVPITGGGRLTGKAGRSNLGLLLMRTGDQRFGDIKIEDNIYAVARVSQDVGEKSNLGLIVTNQRLGGGDSNLAGGADFNLRSVRSWRSAVSWPVLLTRKARTANPVLRAECGRDGTARCGSSKGCTWACPSFSTPAWGSSAPEPGPEFRRVSRGFRSYFLYARTRDTASYAATSLMAVVGATFGDDGTQLTRREHYHFELFSPG